MILGRTVPEQRVIRFDVPPPAEGRFHLAPDNPGPVVVSPDGTMLAYSARNEDGTVQLWVRSLDEAEASPMSGTENAQYPFWSPDSKKIGYFSNGKLRMVEAVGGPPLALCDAGEGKGGAWSSNGVIVFTPSYNTPLHRVSENGGDRRPSRSSTTNGWTTPTATRVFSPTATTSSTWRDPRREHMKGRR